MKITKIKYGDQIIEISKSFWRKDNYIEKDTGLYHRIVAINISDKERSVTLEKENFRTETIVGYLIYDRITIGIEKFSKEFCLPSEFKKIEILEIEEK